MWTGTWACPHFIALLLTGQFRCSARGSGPFLKLRVFHLVTFSWLSCCYGLLHCCCCCCCCFLLLLVIFKIICHTCGVKTGTRLGVEVGARLRWRVRSKNRKKRRKDKNRNEDAYADTDLDVDGDVDVDDPPVDPILESWFLLSCFDLFSLSFRVYQRHLMLLLLLLCFLFLLFRLSVCSCHGMRIKILMLVSDQSLSKLGHTIDPFQLTPAYTHLNLSIYYSFFIEHSIIYRKYTYLLTNPWIGRLSWNTF